MVYVRSLFSLYLDLPSFKSKTILADFVFPGFSCFIFFLVCLPFFSASIYEQIDPVLYSVCTSSILWLQVIISFLPFCLFLFVCLGISKIAGMVFTFLFASWPQANSFFYFHILYLSLCLFQILWPDVIISGLTVVCFLARIFFIHPTHSSYLCSPIHLSELPLFQKKRQRYCDFMS